MPMPANDVLLFADEICPEDRLSMKPASSLPAAPKTTRSARASAAGGWSDAFMYDRMLAKDSAYDGRFLTGVLTTGIYCLPSCPARKPKAENVRFFKTEAEAVAAGLRPCRRCRPDLFYRGDDWERDLFDGLLQRLRADPGAFPDIARLVDAAGIGTTKLNDLIREHAHLTPAALLRRERVRAVCERLLQGKERLVDIALAAGYEGEATFHRQFLALTGMPPGAYRALRDSDRFRLKLPASFRPQDVLGYHGRDPEGPAERIADGRKLGKALVIEGMPLLLEMSFEPGVVDCQVVSAKRPGPVIMAEIHRIACRMIGPGSDVAGFESRAPHLPDIARLIQGQQGLRVPLTATPFEALAWAVIGQQINLAFATALRRALIDLCGAPLNGLRDMKAHPTAAAVAGLDPADLTQRRFSRAKADYLINMARLVTQGELPLDDMADGSAKTAETILRGVRGLGPWTTNYMLMRGLGFADAVPVGDSALATALQRFHHLETRPDAKETARLMMPFAPHRSLATCHFWARLKMAA
jgi:AraC family transcriptional regulator of adaptative response / DNA-3-methyladenine glycosylase II